MPATESWSLDDYLRIADAAIVIIPLVLLAMLIWLAARVGSFVIGLLSSDGTREQRHRHKLENLAGRMTLLCFAAGVFIIATGQGAGGMDVKDIKLPGGIEIGSAGAGVVLIGVGNSLLWMLLNFRRPKSEADDHEATTALAAAAPTRDTPATLSAARWLARLSYWHVGMIALMLCPMINVLAVPAGLLLAWQVSKSRKLVERTCPPHPAADSRAMVSG